MIDEESAKRIADGHIEDQPAPLAGYRMALGSMRQTESGWYFDYRIECDLDIPESEHEQFAGTPGFIVDRASGDISVLSWHDLRALGLSDS